MLTSSKLVLKAQICGSSGGISDSEDSKGYLSEGEQYRRSRFPHPSKSPKDIRSSNKRNTEEKNTKAIYSSDVNISRNSPHLMYEGVFLRKRTKENHNDIVSDSKSNQVENSCPFYFSPIHRHYKRNNIIRSTDEDESHSAGNLIYGMVT